MDTGFLLHSTPTLDPEIYFPSSVFILAFLFKVPDLLVKQPGCRMIVENFFGALWGKTGSGRGKMGRAQCKVAFLASLFGWVNKVFRWCTMLVGPQMASSHQTPNPLTLL